MKLTHINIQNFLGCRSVNVALTAPVTIFAGKNASGKSSLQEAVRMALTGESVRVDMKKDYGQMVSEGAESGFAEVEIDGTVRAFVTLPDGKTAPMTEYVPPTALPYVLDAQRFAKMDMNERRAFLFGLMGLSAGSAEVKKRLLAKGCNDQKVEVIMPILRSGFNAAHKEAQAKARDEKASWRTITGETYGDKKAATWAAEKPVFNAATLDSLRLSIVAIDTSLAAANQRMGALQADHKRHAQAAHRLVELREKGNRRERITNKLAHDEAELKQWEAKVEDARQRAVGGRKVGLVHDLARVAGFVVAVASESEGIAGYHANGDVACWGEFCEVDFAENCLESYRKEHGEIIDTADYDPEVAATLPEYEKAMRLLQSAVANGKRDLAEAHAAAMAINDLEKTAGDAPDETQMRTAQKHLSDLQAQRSDIAAKLAAQEEAQRQANQADERTAKAMAAHEAAQAWIAIADALAPDGIPGEMLSQALGPINERLKQSSQEAQWLHVRIEADMSIFAAYPGLPSRPYALLSESEKWRVDAMLAEAIAHLSKIKLLVLDRFDVLDLAGRADLIAWLDILAQNDEVQTALILGTLKALPANLPPTIEARWLDDGVVAKFKEAA